MRGVDVEVKSVIKYNMGINYRAFKVNQFSFHVMFTIFLMTVAFCREVAEGLETEIKNTTYASLLGFSGSLNSFLISVLLRLRRVEVGATEEN